MNKVTIADRIVLHLSRYELLNEDSFNTKWDLTQDGIAASVRISRAHSSLELKKLKEKGKILECQSHFKGGKVKRRSYSLTPAGMEHARRIRDAAEEEGIDIMPMLDMKRCDPRKLWDSVGEENMGALGLACVIRCPIPRADLPATTRPVIPSDVNGMTVLSDILKRNVISMADEDRKREWHSAAADYWLDRDNIRERLYHLVLSKRIRDACRLIVSEREELLSSVDDDLANIISTLDSVPDRYVTDVIPVMITVSLWSGDLRAVEDLIPILAEKDAVSGLLYSAELEMRKGDRQKALNIVMSVGHTDRFDVDLGTAWMMGRLGCVRESMDILMRMKDELITSGRMDGLDLIYMRMADVSGASGDHDSSINYLTKALGIANDAGKRKIYGMLATSYDRIGMPSKAKECTLKAK